MFFKNKRVVKVTPSKSWLRADSLLGVLIRKENYEEAGDRVLRIMKVMKESPAEKAGLIPQEDYLLGIVGFSYNDLNDLCSFLDLLEECKVKTIEMCIYNKKT